MKAVVLFLLSLFFVSSLSAQKKLHGIVFEITGKADTSILPGTMVKWKGTQEASITNDKGEFVLKLFQTNNTLLLLMLVMHLIHF
jgi:hypothetical protein